MTDVKTCFDKVLPWEINRPQRMMSFGVRQRAVFVFRKMWITGYEKWAAWGKFIDSNSRHYYDEFAKLHIHKECREMLINMGKWKI